MTVSSVLTMGPQIKAGKLRGLAVTSKTRLPDFPDIPTTIESGHPYLTLNPGVCVFAPSEIPQSVLKVLLPAVEKAFKDPEVIDRATKAYIVPDYKGHAEFREFIEIQMKLIEKIVKDAGLQAK